MKCFDCGQEHENLECAECGSRVGEHFNALTGAEQERLSFLVEEMSEAIQAACKVLRHGYESYDPTVPMLGARNNRHALAVELGQVMCAFRMMVIAGDVEEVVVRAAQTEKAHSVGRWMHHQDQELLGASVPLGR